MLAHYHGQTWNAREPAQAMGVNYRAGALFGVECKRTDSSRLTPSIRIASSDLGLRGIAVIYPCTKRCPIAHRVKAVPPAALADNSPIFPRCTTIDYQREQYDRHSGQEAVFLHG